MATLILKRFSIQTGGPDKKPGALREFWNKAKEGAVLGGILGGIGSMFAILSSLLVDVDDRPMSIFTAAKAGAVLTGGAALIGGLVHTLDMLGASKKEREFQTSNANQFLDRLEDLGAGCRQTGLYTTRERYNIVLDQDPKKHEMTVAFENGRMLIFLNKPNDILLKVLNESLEDMIAHNRKSNYVAEENNGDYLVFVDASNLDFAASIVYDIIDTLDVKVNVLTRKSFDKARRK